MDFTDKPLSSVGEQPMGIGGKVLTRRGLQKSIQSIYIGKSIGRKQLVEQESPMRVSSELLYEKDNRVAHCKTFLSVLRNALLQKVIGEL